MSKKKKYLFILECFPEANNEDWVQKNYYILREFIKRKKDISIIILDKKTPEGIHSLFHNAAHSPGSLTLNEEELVTNLAGKTLYHLAMPIGVIHEVPEWLDRLFQKQWGDSYGTEMTALNKTAPVDVRVNTGRVSRNQARKSLNINNIKTN